MQRRREMEMGYLQENHHCCKAHCGVIQTFRMAGNEAATPVYWSPLGMKLQFQFVGFQMKTELFYHPQILRGCFTWSSEPPSLSQGRFLSPAVRDGGLSPEFFPKLEQTSAHLQTLRWRRHSHRNFCPTSWSGQKTIQGTSWTTHFTRRVSPNPHCHSGGSLGHSNSSFL